MPAHLLGYFNLSDLTLGAFLNFCVLSLPVLVTEQVRTHHKGNEVTVEWQPPCLHLSIEAVHMH